MICPFCEADDVRVLHTDSGAGIAKRRRACKSCGRRFNTTERTEDEDHGVKARVRRAMREAQENLDEIKERYL